MAKIDVNKAERAVVEQKLKGNNRVFHSLKHELCELNPIGSYEKEE